MCRHCENLLDDKQIVHDFMRVAAERLSVMRQQNINVDDIDVVVELKISEFVPNPFYLRGLKALYEMDKENVLATILPERGERC